VTVLNNEAMRGRRGVLRSCPHALLLAFILHFAQLQRAKAEDRLDFKFYHYREDDDRIRVISPAFLYETEISPTIFLKLDGVYDAISGATPTGAPPVPKSNGQTKTESGHHATTGASGTVTSPAQHTKALSLPFSELTVPTIEVEDERLAGRIELIKKLNRHVLSGQLSYSNERDYDSIGFAVKNSTHFNNKNTTLLAGIAYSHDVIDLVPGPGTDNKDVVDMLVGVTQILGPKTLLSANVAVGYMAGYLDDPYKVVEINRVLVAERRPGHKHKEAVRLSLNHRVVPLDGTLESSYRFYDDSYGITGHTAALAWYQDIGDNVIVRPMVRLHDQSAAKFYAVRFSGSPTEYSSDYRLSALNAISYGAKLIIAPSARLSIDCAYERYALDGKDDVTHEDVYPSADIFSVGARLWL